MSTQSKSRQEKLAAAIGRLPTKTNPGEGLRIADVAARSYTDAQAHARSVAAAQARTFQKLGRSRRFKG